MVDRLSPAGGPRVLRLLSISDIHLGHRRTPTQLTIASLEREIFPLIAELDLIIVGGDYFDNLLELTNASVHDITCFTLRFLAKCHQHGVILRFMLGTRLHDRNQLEFVIRLYQRELFTNDVRYIDTIKLEYIEALDLKLLYLPDDLPYGSTDDIIAVVKGQLAELGWAGVDYAAVHGMFQDAMPAGVVAHGLVWHTDQFDFVQTYVLCAHFHTHMTFGGGKFFYNSSFDRLAHNEEEAKGCVLIEDDRRGKRRLRFIENRHAAIYRTIDLSGYGEVEAAIAAFHDAARGLPDNPARNLRVIHPSAEVRAALQRTAATCYPQIRYTHQGTKQAVEERSEIVAEEIAAPSFVTPTLETLPRMVLEYLAAKGVQHQLDETLISRFLQR